MENSQKEQTIPHTPNTESQSLQDQKKYRVLLEHFSSGILSFDKETNITWCNENLARLMGVPREKIIGINILATVKDPEQKAALLEALNGRIGVFEGKYTFIIGNRSGYIRSTYSPIFGTDGSITSGICTTDDISERMLAENALRESEEKYRTLFDTMAQGVVYQNANGEIISANPAAEQILGLTLDQMKGITSMDPRWRAVREDGSDFPGEFHPIPIALKTGKKVESMVHGVFNPEKNDYVWIKVNAIPLFRPGETKPFQAYGIIENITEQKKSEQNYQMLFREMLDGFALHEIICDENGTPVNYRFIDANPAFERMTGMKRQDIIGQRVLDVMPGTEPYWIETYGKVALTGEPIFFENYAAALDKHFEVTAFRPAANQFACIFTDISVRKRAEMELHKSELKYRSLFTEMKSGCTLQQIIFDDQGKPKDYFTIDMNAAAEKLLGIKKDQVLGKQVSTLLKPEEFEKWLTLFGDIATGGKPAPYQQYSPQNNKFFEGQVFSPEYGQFAVTFDDVTMKKQVEEALQHSQKLESLGILAGGIAHDFNNLLGGIFGYIDFALENCEDATISKYLTKTMNTIDRARALTQQLLTFAKGGTPIKNTQHLFPFVQETAQFALSGSRVLCACTIPPDLWPCDFDKNQIGQVIDNVVINAQQAMPNSGTIEITAKNQTLTDQEHPTLSSGLYVKISIKDHGIGIPKEFLPHIFDPFYSTKPKGHGLGLATCYSIINRHGGCIDVESEPGKGSTFHLFLPASQNAVVSLSPVQSPKHAGNGTFLVMDDEDVLRETLKDMLTSLGYTVVLTNNGQEAIDFFSKEIEANRTVAGMIFDLTIPGGMGGKEAIVEIRKLSTDIPVFVASGYAQDPIMAHPNDYGFTASLRKPFRKSEFTSMLNTHMRQSKGI